MGRTNDAELAFSRALKLIPRQATGVAALVRGNAYAGIGALARDAGRYPAADAALCRAQRCAERAVGPSDPGLANFLNARGVLYKFMARFDEAEELLMRAPCEQLYSTILAGWTTRAVVTIQPLFTHDGPCAYADA